MIGISKESIDHIPVLHIVKHTKKRDKLPLIIFIHGITSAKEQNLNYAYLLAEEGFRVILPDALHHGERTTGKDGGRLKYSFWEIVLQTISEMETIKDHYQKLGLIDPERIGAAGTSMGGIITHGALARYDWIKAGVSLMGNPAYVRFAKKQIEHLKLSGIDIPLSEAELDQLYSTLGEYDLTLQAEKLSGRPLMFWHGGKDPVVPYEDAYQFYESILPQYGNDKESISFILDEEAEHKVTMEGLHGTRDWFRRHL
ncbi:esterase [Peribacillus sp. SCS-37]|uniref:esterase n=1 Tax=Paraperibacillus esterisolvens TaxID=3115296 RepID=UPI003906CF4D